MRRIVTTNVEGRSRVLDDTELAGSSWINLWATSPDKPLGFNPGKVEETFPVPPAGHSSWQIVSLPPASQMRQALAAGVPGLDENGFHVTGTIDFVVVLDGPVTLVLDDGEVVVGAGDIVVQRDTNHAWWNHNDHPVRLLALMTGLAK